jgi:hypothetical protein
MFIYSLNIVSAYSISGICEVGNQIKNKLFCCLLQGNGGWKSGLILLVMLMSCNPKAEVKTSKEENNIYKHYYDGKLQAEFTIKDGVKEGLGKIYYLNGRLSATCNYVNGLKNGVEDAYYYNSSLYRTREYSNGVLNGIEKRFYRNGKLKTQLSFKSGMPGKGLIEYYESGKLKTKYPKFLYKVVYDRDYKKQKLLLFYFSDYRQNVYYYEGSLLDGKYFNKNAVPTGNLEGVGEMVLDQTFSGEIVISAKYITSNRAPYVVENKIVIE